MQVPTVEKILVDVLAFLAQGEEFARKHPGNEISTLIKSAVRLGVDAHAATSNILADLTSIQRQLRKLRRIWVILITRCIMILAAVICIRRLLLQTLDPRSWPVWTRTDRLLLVTALFLTVILMGALINRYVVRGWGPYLHNRVWTSVSQYMTMGLDHVGCLELRQNLKKIARDEWRTGLSGQSARLLALKNRITTIGDDLEQECVALAAVTSGVELSVFSISFMGFNFAPLMAWIESASGVN